MKSKLEIISVVASLICGSLYAAADSSSDISSVGDLRPASKIIGDEVRDAAGARLGKIADLAIDLQNGRVVEVIVGRDKFYTAVPSAKFVYDGGRKSVRFTADGARLQSAALFKMSDWDATTEQASVADVYRYYDTRPYFIADDSAAKTNGAALQLGEIQRGSKIIGTSVHNLHGQKIGRIENLMIDLPTGRIAEVIVSSGGFLGLEGELSAIPPQSFRPGTENGALSLDTTEEALAAAPHFKASQWPNLRDTHHLGEVYHSYHIAPYFDTNAPDNTAQNAQDQKGQTLTPLDQGHARGDVEITRQIRKAIIAADNLSVDARNVKIITLDGKVTLRGPVKTDDEKRRVQELAASITPTANIDNELRPRAVSGDNLSQ